MASKNNRKRFDKIADSIKRVKIQGAANVARAALSAYSMIPTKASMKKLLSLRPTEPMLERVLRMQRKKDIRKF